MKNVLHKVTKKGLSYMFVFELLFSSLFTSLVAILILCVVFVNGFTDAPNAIATTVGTDALNIKNACMLSAGMNMIGLVLSGLFRPAVTETVFSLLDLKGNNYALLSLFAAMVAILLWAVTAWYFGIPTSESHALIAGLTGSSIALNNDFSLINVHEWKSVVTGLIISSAIGLLCSYVLYFSSEKVQIQKRIKNQNRTLKRLQIWMSCVLSMLHGAQDGQKFLGIFLLLLSLLNQNNSVARPSIALMLLCAVFMGIGTAFGGKRIIQSIGFDLTPLKPMQAVISDLSACLGIAVSTFSGMPISTTHVKTMAIIGVGIANQPKNINKALMKDIIFTWILTFPGCGFLGYLTTKLLIHLF